MTGTGTAGSGGTVQSTTGQRRVRLTDTKQRLAEEPRDPEPPARRGHRRQRPRLHPHRQHGRRRRRGAGASRLTRRSRSTGDRLGSDLAINNTAGAISSLVVTGNDPLAAAYGGALSTVARLRGGPADPGETPRAAITLQGTGTYEHHQSRRRPRSRRRPAQRGPQHRPPSPPPSGREQLTQVTANTLAHASRSTRPAQAPRRSRSRTTRSTGRRASASRAGRAPSTPRSRPTAWPGPRRSPSRRARAPSCASVATRWRPATSRSPAIRCAPTSPATPPTTSCCRPLRASASPACSQTRPTQQPPATSSPQRIPRAPRRAPRARSSPPARCRSSDSSYVRCPSARTWAFCCR